jgi:hypothetical protein
LIRLFALVLGLVVSTGSAFAMSDDEALAMIQRWYKAHLICTGDNADTEEGEGACDFREFAGEELVGAGWCFGRKGQPWDDGEWRKCEQPAPETRSQPDTTFRYGDWFGEEDWSAEVCRVSRHVGEGVFFFAQQDWQGNFWIGIYDSRGRVEDTFSAVGAVAFDDSPPLVLQGKADDGRLLFAARSPSTLNDLFRTSWVLRLSVNDAWAVVPLNGSSRAASFLAQCAKSVWPGAGDEEDVPE